MRPNKGGRFSSPDNLLIRIPKPRWSAAELRAFAHRPRIAGRVISRRAGDALLSLRVFAQMSHSVRHAFGDAMKRLVVHCGECESERHVNAHRVSRHYGNPRAHLSSDYRSRGGGGTYSRILMRTALLHFCLMRFPSFLLCEEPNDVCSCNSIGKALKYQREGHGYTYSLLVTNKINV